MCQWILTWILCTLFSPAHAFDFNGSATSALQLDLSAIGRIAFTGAFDALSTYDYQESVISTLGSKRPGLDGQSIRAQLPDGTFMNVVTADAAIEEMCVFYPSHSSEVAGLIVAGNFTSIDGVEALSIALFDYAATDGHIVPLPGIHGTIRTLLCDAETASVYAAGDLMAANSTNVITWRSTEGWENLPFGGMNGPVNSIAKTSAGTIVFGGSFDRLGNQSLEVNGLFEFTPQQAVSSTPLIDAGLGLDPAAAVNKIVTFGESVYVAGNFSGPQVQNVFVVEHGISKPLAGGGLNGPVTTMFWSPSDNMLFFGGNFTGTANGSTPGLNNLARYSVLDQKWHSLGSGVNGRVESINSLALNISIDKPETILIVNGKFGQILASDGNVSASVAGIGVWVPSRNNWLSNLSILNQPEFDGVLATSVELPVSAELPQGLRLFAGTLSSWILSANGAIELNFNSGKTGFGSFGLNMDTENAAGSDNSVLAGLFYEAGPLNITVVGGTFAARDAHNLAIYNVVFINATDDDSISGMPGFVPDANVRCLETLDHTLFVGGSFYSPPRGSGGNGLLAFDLVKNAYSEQPPVLGAGDDVVVQVMSVRPNTKHVYVGGFFDNAGSVKCPSLCYYDTSLSQWKRPGSNLGGSVGFMTWTSSDTLVVAGNVTIDGTPVSLATYYAPADQWTPFNELHPLTGTVTAMSPTQLGASGKLGWSSDSAGFWVAGQESIDSTSAFLKKWNGTVWHSVEDGFGRNSSIQGLQLLSLSKNGSETEFLAANEVLLVFGNMSLPEFGSVSAALFNGTNFIPYVFTKTGSGDPGTLSSVFSTIRVPFTTSGKYAVEFDRCPLS